MTMTAFHRLLFCWCAVLVIALAFHAILARTISLDILEPLEAALLLIVLTCVYTRPFFSSSQGKEPTEKAAYMYEASLEPSPHDMTQGANPVLVEPVGLGVQASSYVDYVAYSEQRARATSSSSTTTVTRVPDEDGRRPRPRPRYYFLDYSKLFLTFLVVTFHVGDFFGAISYEDRYRIGNYDNPFRVAIRVKKFLCQSFFMSCFFSIAAFFTDKSYRRKGRMQFLKDRAWRLLLPSWFCTFVLNPIQSLIELSSSENPLAYHPFPGHCWFLLWLLLLSWVYMTLADAYALDGLHRTHQNVSKDSNIPLPRLFPTRLVWGYGAGSVATAILLLPGWHTFFTMPVKPGSLPCDIVLFGAGVLASRYKWFDGTDGFKLRDKLGCINVWVYRTLVFGLCAAGALAVVMNELDLHSYTAIAKALFLLAGCLFVELSLALLEFCQTNLNHPLSAFTEFLARSAFTVYLVHKVVIASMVALFVYLYNLPSMTIEFEEGLHYSSSVLRGPANGAWHLLAGYCFVCVATLTLAWIWAWGLMRVPFLRHVL
mmetsp:Transcript_31260/g.67669  ORF Transcript_31260/g.67669 Transcript_31260/m.67669 type:complete len:542 (-) Transcript_31260:127-1752(-)